MRRFSLLELMIASTLCLLLVAMVISFVIMASDRMKSNQNQLAFNHRGRFGGEKITNIIKNARVVSAGDSGFSALIGNLDSTLSQVYFDNPDGNMVTVEDNNLVYDRDTEITGDESVLIERVTPIGGEPMFEMVGTALAVRFHTGDSFPSVEYDRLTGKGYQGLLMRILARPRNAGEIWEAE